MACVSPDIDQYAGLLYLFGRNENLSKARDLIQEMHYDPTM